MTTKKYTTINIAIPIRDKLTALAKRYNVSVALLIECLLHIDNDALDSAILSAKNNRLIDKYKRAKDKRAIRSRLEVLPHDKIAELLKYE